jgi:hypothetical protein
MLAAEHTLARRQRPLIQRLGFLYFPYLAYNRLFTEISISAIQRIWGSRTKSKPSGKRGASRKRSGKA